MSAWEILGIDPTDDERAIKQAYAKALKHNKPDKNPEGFKALREAYETALATRYYYANDDSDDDDDNENNDWQENHIINDTAKHDFNKSHLNDSDLSPNQQIPELPHHSDTPNNPSSHGLIINSHTTAYDENLVIHMNTDMIDDENTMNHDDVIYANEMMNEPELSDVWYHIDNDEGMMNEDKDNALLRVLQEQAEQLYQIPLDERMSYEQELLEFFVWRDDIYSKSYEWVFHQFGWQSILDSWQVERYPWHHLSTLQERYKTNFIHIKYLSRNTDLDDLIYFENLLKEEYPTFNSYYHKMSDNKFVNIWVFIKNSFYPQNLIALKNDLALINHELQKFKHRDDKNNHLFYTLLNDNKHLTQLKHWVFHGIFNIKWVIIGCFPVWAFTTSTLFIMTGHDFNTISNHVIPIIAFIALLMIFWQLRWRLFVYPHKFSHQGQTIQPNGNFLTSLYVSLPVILPIMFFSTYRRWKENEVIIDGVSNIAELYDKPSYFIAHLMGLGFWYTLMRANRYDNPFAIQAYWFGAFTLIMLSIFNPLMASLLDEHATKELAIAITPLFWLAFCIPIGIHLLAVHEFKFLHPVAHFSLKALIGFSGIMLFFVWLVAFSIVFELPILGLTLMLGLYLVFKSTTLEQTE